MNDRGDPCVVAVRADGDDPGDRLAAIAERVTHPWREVGVPAGGTDALRAALDDVAGTAIAVVASGAAAGPAIDAASYDPRVVAVCTLGGPVPPTAARVFELWKDVPVLAVVEASDRDALGAAVELRFASTHPDSDIEVVSDLDVGDRLGVRIIGRRLDRCHVDRRVVARPPPGGRRRTTRGGRAQR